MTTRKCKIVGCKTLRAQAEEGCGFCYTHCVEICERGRTVRCVEHALEQAKKGRP